MGEQVMAMGAARGGDWHRAGLPVSMAVNLSASQVTRSLPPTVARLAAEHRLPPERLCLELTETALLEAQGDGVGVLKDLAALGVRLAIDDFGTGYSSFAYMRDLPVHEIKLDISFVTRLGRDERDARVVAGMIRLAHDLGLRVVAEGVEEPAQLATLRRLGCDGAQGFLFARPSEDPIRSGIANAHWPRAS
jgi:EAL domain-containing protein (putative c-di-GMP-specific phosphodiesterase class I)